MGGYAYRFAQGKGSIIVAQIDAATVQLANGAGVESEQACRTGDVALRLGQGLASVEAFDFRQLVSSSARQLVSSSARQLVSLVSHQTRHFVQDGAAECGWRATQAFEAFSGAGHGAVHISSSASSEIGKGFTSPSIKAFYAVFAICRMSVSSMKWSRGTSGGVVAGSKACTESVDTICIKWASSSKAVEPVLL